MTGPLIMLRAVWDGPWGIWTGLKRFGRWLDGESTGATILIILVGTTIGGLAIIGWLAILWLWLIGRLV